MRRLVTFVLVASGTATGLIWWLHDGDLRGVASDLEPLVAWEADLLARDAGVAPSEPVVAPAPPIEQGPAPIP